MSYRSIEIDGGPSCRVVEQSFREDRGESVVLSQWPFGPKHPGGLEWMLATLVERSGSEVQGSAQLWRFWRRQGAGAEGIRVELGIRLLDA